MFLDLCHQNTTVRSRIEAEAVVELVLSLLMGSLPGGDRRGGALPRPEPPDPSLLRRNLMDDEIVGKLVVDTVERMQGQEREVVLVSFATAAPGLPRRCPISCSNPSA